MTTVDADDLELLRLAKVARHADIVYLGQMSRQEVAYLADLHHLPDPDSDGLDCDTGVRTV